MTYSVWIFDGGDLFAAIHEPEIALIIANGFEEKDAIEMMRMLSERGIGVCVLPEYEE